MGVFPHKLGSLVAVLAALLALACNEPVQTRGAVGRRVAAVASDVAAGTVIKGQLALAADPTNAGAVSFAGATVFVAGKPDLKATVEASGVFTLTLEAAPPPTPKPVNASVGGFGLQDPATTVTLYAFFTLAEIPYAGISSDVPVKKGETTNVGAFAMKATGVIKGRVVLQAQNEHAGTTVSLPLAGLTTTSDNLGNFVIPGVPDGPWRVRYEHAGFLTQDSEPVTVAAGIATELPLVTLFSSTGTSAVVTVNGGLEIAASRAVDVQIEPSPNATLMMTAEEESFTGVEWRPLQRSFVYAFTADGERTLFVKVADDAGTASPVYQATVWIADRDKDLALDAVDCAPDDPALAQKRPYTMRDADGDGKYIVQAGEVCSGAALPAGFLATSASDERDCNDDDPSIFVLAAAATDFDGDGHGGAQVYVCMGATPPIGYVATGGDCDDQNPDAWQLSTAFVDQDQDGKGEGEGTSLCAGDELPAGKVAVSGDEFPNDQARHAYLGAVSWGGNSADLSHAMARLPGGDLVLLGSYAATDATGVDLDFTAGANPQVKLAGGRNVYVTRMGDDGTYAWSAIFDGALEDLDAFGVASDSTGDVYATGTYVGTVDFDPGAGTQNQSSNGGGTIGDAFVVKLSDAGAYEDVLVFGGTPAGGVGKKFQPRKVAVDANDNVYVAGVFPDATALDAALTGGAGDVATTGGGDDGWAGFLMQLDVNLNVVWMHSWGLGVEHDVTGLTVDGDGNVYVAGNFRGTADFDWTAGTDTVTSVTGKDAYVIKVASNGTYQFSKRLLPAGGGTVRIRALAADADADLAIAGGFVGDVDFDPGTATDLRHSVDPATDDIFVLKLSGAGAKKWAYVAGGSYHDRIHALAIDAQNAIFLGGEIGYGDAPNSGGAVDLGPSSAVDARTTKSDGDALVMKLAADGSYKWSKSFGSASVAAHTCDDRVDALSFDEDDGEDVRAFGRSGCSTDYDFTDGGTDYRVNAGGSDVFVSKF